ncbi:MAG: sigma-54-dependent Fis family transcriptional regulator [Candidatus Hydrogenedentota bacterium]|nr:MAG: sigma-54-dependent Fis family transcriptional regulator [Candidatus Hydrogenedentota bacterium]
MSRILIADDEIRITEALRRLLELEGYDTLSAGDGEEVLKMLSGGGVDLVLLDLDMPRKDGIETLREMRRSGHSLPVLIVSGKGTIAKAVEAVRLGAYDFIEKPVDDERLLLAIQRALEFSNVREERDLLRSAEKGGAEEEIFSEEESLRSLAERAEKAAKQDLPILIRGETGSGKEVFARWIHRRSERSRGPFVPLNCAALPDSLAESELFGHVRGAFTGATRDRRGRFELARGGTLFLDEVAELTAPLQAKLLRAIETGEFQPLGAERSVKSNARILSATHKDLREAVAKGEFREDLFFRLAVVEFVIPPLRERPRDLRRLAVEFLRDRFGRSAPVVEEEAFEVLAGYRWPGNIRELRNVVDRAALFAEGGRITPDDVRDALPSGAFSTTAREEKKGTLRSARDESERAAIEEALSETGGNVSAAARLLGIDRAHLYRKMKKLGVGGRG